MAVKSVVKIDSAKLKQLSQAAIKALEMTGEELHKEIMQAQVIPRDEGTLQGEKFRVDYDNSSSGKVSLIHEGPYARRWYYNPETVAVRKYTIKRGKRAGTEVNGYTAHKATFSKAENPKARDHWFEPWQKGGENEKFVPETFKKFYKRFSGL